MDTLFCLAAATTLLLAKGQSYDDLVRLEKLLFPNYSSTWRPVRNLSHVTNISIQFTIASLVSMDILNEQIVNKVILRLSWYDQFLVWNSSEYGGIETIAPRRGTVWEPMLLVPNAIQQWDMAADATASLSVGSTGLVMILLGGPLKTSFPVDMTKFPFDTQVISISLYPVQYDKNEVVFSVSHDDGIPDSLRSHGEWTIKSSSFEAVIPSGNRCGVELRMIIQRKPIFYILSIILPISLLSFLNMVVFAVPAESGEKLSFSLTTMLSLAVYMSFVSQIMPNKSVPLSFMAVYLASVLCLSALAILATVFVLRLYHKPETETPPFWVTQILCVKKAATGAKVTFREVSATLDVVFGVVFGLCATLAVGTQVYVMQLAE
ncbi:acetylcholine receptor subunit alpha-like [Haliotis rufescens]|uniref:acetylcholine receptor subunit alpha-like n=1 Tax=Haliotis rufescens TaxID=6454 RepID=UPI00201F6274|nr:acetylcholine receptor subunit alpha-like [Haliotis rufescens]